VFFCGVIGRRFSAANTAVLTGAGNFEKHRDLPLFCATRPAIHHKRVGEAAAPAEKPQVFSGRRLS